VERIFKYAKDSFSVIIMLFQFDIHNDNRNGKGAITTKSVNVNHYQ